MQCRTLRWLRAGSLVIAAAAMATPTNGQSGAVRGDWRYDAADARSTKDPSLDQIDDPNTEGLRMARRLPVDGSPAGIDPHAASSPMPLNKMMAGSGGVPAAQAPASSHNVTRADLERWRKELSNWGRWGSDDEIGTMNLITAEKRKQAAALVKEGLQVSLAADADTQKAVDNPRPYEHQMLGIGSDRIGVTHHGWAHTHLDSLAHHHDEGVFYNGYKPNEAEVLKSGHSKNSIHNLKHGVFTRGILIDIPRLRGVPYLEPGTPIYVEDLEAFEKMAGIRVAPGDVLLIRTGVWAYRQKLGPWERGRGGRVAGPHASVLPWLKARGVAILGTDGQSQVAPSDLPGAVHDFAMSVLGIHVLDNADLEAVGEMAASRKRWEFLFSAAPLPIKGGTGSPVNPIATF